ncbi:hypothetical protein HELRODRAFT_177867 [Helobdella robusta]|uniref:Protein rolling stone n=1 Tax=Helobdella robusta TaxID=6412 RepID=T1FCE1_HELRO|nr:hypothetical protein HELRODRAFT_177867 [Helobdella robusta]ESN97802.1 hypothetical protein HELRODRAFT_177867 [Helobdella robusta]
MDEEFLVEFDGVELHLKIEIYVAENEHMLWPIPTIIFLLFKVLIAVYTGLFTIFAPTFVGLKYFCYLTNVSYTIVAIYFIISAFRTVIFEVLFGASHKIQFASDSNNHNSKNQVMKVEDQSGAKLVMLKVSIYVEWMARHLGYCLSLIVCVSFYSLEARVDGEPGTSLFDVNSHIVINFIVFIDLFLSATPVKLFHFIWLIILGMFYALFTYFYFNANGETLYKSLNDRTNPSASLMYSSMIAIFGSILSTLLIYCCYLLRIFLYIKLRLAKKKIFI